MERFVVRQPCHSDRRPLILAAVAACFAVNAQALPRGPVVINGTASFAQTGNVLSVANSNGAIINWQSFGIAAGETTRFVQPSSSSVVLNQVLSNNPSAIYGTLSSNGKVWLVNTAGILVGPGALIDTAGFVGSTLTVRAEDFLAGRLTFQATPGAGNVVNQGTITTPAGGSVYLVGSNVANEGIITTPRGETVLAAGQTVSLIDTATPGVKVEITGSANNATNLGSIVAEAGRIGIAGAIVRNSGTLDASSVVSEGGHIFLRASQDTYADRASRLVATGSKGGQVEVLGNRVAVMDQAEIDVSGASGGGKVMVGGDFQGNNPDIQNAQIAYFGPQATIRANATKAGDAGTVIVWADDTARAGGTIEARGGPDGGRGGLVETSGHRYLDVDGIRIDTRAPNGSAGTWLLDPDSITVVASAGADSGGSWSGGIFGSGGSDATVSWTTIDGNLATGNVKLQTGTGGTGDISFLPGTYSSANRNLLSLWAYGGGASTGHISFNNAILSLAGGLEVVGGWNGTANSYSTVAGRGDITMTNSQIVADGSISIYGGNLTLTSLRSNQQSVALTATGDVLLSSSFTGYFDDYSFVYNLPFAFTYYGNRYTQAYITTNGLIAFPTNGAFAANGGTYVYSDSASGLSNLTDDVSGTRLAVIAPAWNDWILRASTGKDVLIKQLTNSTLGVQWVVSKYADEGNTANFEALLSRNGNIQFNYGSASTSYAGDVTIGLSDGTTSIVSNLMSRPNFSLNFMPSTTFVPTGSTGYTETVGSASVPLANMTGAVSGGRLLESSYASSGTSGISALLGSVNINAGGLVNGYTGVEALQLSAASVGGLILTGSVGRFSAANTGSGDVLFSNSQPLTLAGITNSAGNISVDNVGGVTVAANVSASGAVTLAAQSPMTINSGVVITAGGDITLIASGVTTADLLAINGGVSSTSGSVALTGGGGVDIGPTASLSAPLGSIQAISDFGSVVVSPFAAINTPNFLVNGIVTTSGTSTSPVAPAVIDTIVSAAQTSPVAQPTEEVQLSTLLVPLPDTSLRLLEQSISQTIGGGTDEFAAQEVLESATSREEQGRRLIAQCRG